MNCERIQDLMLTDYSDNELKTTVRKEIEAHLKNCRECREFEMTLRVKVRQPFKDAGEIRPPDFVWHRIKDTIIQDIARQESIFDHIFSRIRKYLVVPRYAFVYASIVVVMLSALVFNRMHTNNSQLVSEYFREQSDFLVYLNGNGQGANRTGEDLDYNNDIADIDFL